jgi:hypothetical protein
VVLDLIQPTRNQQYLGRLREIEDSTNLMFLGAQANIKRENQRQIWGIMITVLWVGNLGQNQQIQQVSRGFEPTSNPP